MKSITYIGAHDEVIIPSLGIRCANGQTIEVEDDEIAEGLLAQGSYPEHLAADGVTVVPAQGGTEWIEAGAPRATKPKKKAATAPRVPRTKAPAPAPADAPVASPSGPAADAAPNTEAV